MRISIVFIVTEEGQKVSRNVYLLN